MKNLLITTAAVAALYCGSAVAAPNAKEDKGGLNARIEEALSKLPPAKAELFRKDTEKSRESNKAGYEKIRAIRAEMRGLLLAPKFDQKAYLAKASESAKLSSDVQMRRAEGLANFAAQLTPEERKTFVEAFPTHEGKGKGDKE